MIRLTLTDKTGESQTHFFEGTSLTIGRLRHNDLVLPKTNVSKRHVKIVWKNQQFTVMDLRSTNGTFVNGQKITTPVALEPDDVVNVGDYAINVELEQESDAFQEPAPPSPPMDENTPPVLDALSEDAEAMPVDVLDGMEDPFAEFIPPTTSMSAEDLPVPKIPPKKPGKGLGSTMALGSRYSR